MENLNNIKRITLNEEQIKPVHDTDGVIVVTAGAGSGKTRVLTQRVLYLIEEKRVSEDNILAITFTNKAANELKERLQKEIQSISRVWVSTFHSMCVKILRNNIQYLTGYNQNFTIYDDDDQSKVITKILKDLKVDNDMDFKKSCIYHISRAKNEGLYPNEYFRLNLEAKGIEEIVEVYKKYDEELHNNNALDFDDLLMKTFELFSKNPQVLDYYQSKFQYIHVDEFQDTNTVQYKLVKLLAGKYKNLFVVGDEDQSIYSWRGANIENLKNLMLDFPNVKLYKLQQNYRSTKKILKIANKLIKYNSSRIDKELWTENSDGEEVCYFQAYDEKEEAEHVARKISNFIYNNQYEYKDIAILSRINALTYNFEEKLLNYNIPYIVYGNMKFFDRVEIKNILAYLKIFVNNADNTSLLRIINIPKRGIGSASIDKLLELCKVNNEPLFNVILNLHSYNLPNSLKSKLTGLYEIFNKLNALYESAGLYEFVEELIKTSNIKAEYLENTEENVNRKMNIDTFIQSVESFEKQNPDATLSSYIESVTLESTLDSKADDGNSVIISTVHACKGLEFKVVFVVGCEEGIFPLSRSLDNINDLEEDRRLMYVAVTRAKELVTLTRSKSRFMYGARKFTVESRFLKEMGLSIPQQNMYSNNETCFGDDSFAERKGGYQWEKFKQSSTTMQKDYKETKVQQYLKDNTTKINVEDYTIGSTVSHIKFGVGTILKVEKLGDNSFVSVDFGSLGVKTLSLAFAPLKILVKK